MIELAGIAALLLIALVAEHRNHRHEIEALIDQSAQERQKLLERIQRPERIPVEPQTQILAPLETDGNELAKLGAIFPEDEE